MINRDENPVGWAMMMYELADAHEHLGAMIKDIEVDLEFSEEEFRIHLGHVYAHLNRAWRRRLIPGEMTENEWEAGREFPNDIQPIA
jgi:hypothetical protein